MAKIIVECPNCQGEAERYEKDGKILLACETCDAVFEVTKIGPKVVKAGVIAELVKEVASLRKEMAELRGGVPKEEPNDKKKEKGGIEIKFGEDRNQQ